ncbi:MAG: PAS domain S-box protein [Oceanospirillaceae bacterium]|nr:PAS domain S-box protein [Oceanospirillaceae bacterium]
MVLSVAPYQLLAGFVFALLVLLSQALVHLTGAGVNLWLPNAFAFALLLRSPKPAWPMYLLVFAIGNVLCDLLTGSGPLAAGLDTLTNLLFCAGGAWLLRRMPAVILQNDNLRSVMGLILFYTLIFSPLSAFLFAVLNVHGVDFSTLWIQHWLGDVLGMLLIFVPAYCLDMQELKRLKMPRRLGLLVALILFGSGSSFLLLHFIPFPYIYVAIPFGLIALQYGLLPTVIVTPVSLLISSILIWEGSGMSPAWLGAASADALLAATVMAGFFPYVIALSNRIARLQQTEVAELKERLELATQSIGLGVWDWHVNSGALHWDAAMFSLYALDPAASSNTYEMWRSRVHPDDIDAAEKLLSQAVAGTGEYKTEFRVVLPGGGLRWVMAAALVIRDPQGIAQRVVGMNWDNTERKQVEINYQNAKKRLQAVIDAAEDFSIIATDMHGKIEVFSRGAERMLGYTADEMEFQQTPAILHDMQEVMVRGEELSREFGAPIAGFEVFIFKAQQGITEKRQWTYIHKNGHRLQVRLTISPIHDVNKNLTGFLGIAQDISEEIESRDALQFALEQINQQADIAEQAKQQFETLFTLAPEPLLVVNQAGFIVQANLRAHELFKYPSNGLLGLNVDALVPDNMREHHNKHRDSYNAAPRKRVMGKGLGLSGLQKDGALVALDINLAPIIIRNQMHTIVTLHDVTMERQTQQLLSDAAAKAEAMSRAKSEFVASMSHEIRTPMNAVLASSQLLQGTHLTEGQNRYVRMINSAGNALLGILNDILDFSKIEAGKFELHAAAFEPTQLCETLASIMAANAAQKNLELVISLDHTLPSVVKGDVARLQQVLINLLGNAIKFTEKGEVLLQIQAVQHNVENVCIRFSVQDTGIGMSPQDQAKLFMPFSQVDSSNTRKYGGTGLGLTISQRLVNMMGGEINVKSNAGEGSEFYFEVDFPVVEENLRDYKKIEDLIFYVLEKNQHSRDVIAEYLSAWDYEYHICLDASELPLNTEKHSCILLDWGSAEDTPAVIGRLNANPNVQVLVLVSGQQQFSVQEHNELNIAGVINKPILGSSLYDTLMNIFAKQNNAPKLLSDTHQPLEDLRILLVEDNALNQMVATEILETLGASVVVAENGLVALETLRDKAPLFDLVLMDVQMPVMDGFEATRKIRYELRQNIPILAMTAGVMASERQSCIDAGMDDFIAKPIDISQMLTVIQANMFKRG